MACPERKFVATAESWIQGLKAALHSAIGSPRIVLTMMAFSFVFSFFQSIPRSLDQDHWWALALMNAFAAAIPLTALLLFAYAVIEALACCRKNAKSRPISRVMLKAFAVILGLWLVYYVVFFPGAGSTDSTDILKETLGLQVRSDWFRYDTINNHHPILYVVLVGLFVNAGKLVLSVEAGIAAFTFFQMTVMAAIAAYCVRYVYDRTASQAMAGLTLLFFSANPLAAMYSFTLWKDVLFSGFFVLFLLELLDVVLSKGAVLKNRRRLLRFMLVSLIMSLLRSNSFLVIIAVFASLLLVKQLRRRAIAYAGFATLAVCLAIQGPLLSAAGVQPGHFAESVSIPLQQIARSYAGGGVFTEDQEAFLDGILPKDEFISRYNPIGVNPIKFSPSFDDEYLEAHKSEFLLTWMQVVVQNPRSSVSAWIDVTQGYWRIGMDGSGNIAGAIEVPLDNEGVVESLGDTVSYETRNAFFEKFKKALFPFFTIPCLVWFSLFVLVCQICRLQNGGVIVCLPFAIYWLTYLVASPLVYELRYFYAFHLALPVLFLVLLFPFDRIRMTDSEKGRTAVDRQARKRREA